MKTSFFERYGVVVAFLVLFIAACAWKPDVFLNPESFRNLLNQNAAIGIVAIGMTLVIVAGGIDLSVGSIMGITGGLGLTLLNRQVGGGGSDTFGVVVSVITSLGLGLLLGLANGLMVTWGRLAPFIATLVGLVAYRSFVLALADGGEIRSSSAGSFQAFGNGGIPLPFIQVSGGQSLVITWNVITFFAVAAIFGYVLNQTRFGRYAVAVGSNERAARYSAINVNQVKLATYSLLGLCCGLASIGLAARMNSVSSSSHGIYYELDAIAAVVIGGTSMKGGRGRIWGTVVGVLLVGLISNMLAVSGVSAYWQGLVKGLIILLAVLIQRGKNDR